MHDFLAMPRLRWKHVTLSFLLINGPLSTSRRIRWTVQISWECLLWYYIHMNPSYCRVLTGGAIQTTRSFSHSTKNIEKKRIERSWDLWSFYRGGGCDPGLLTAIYQFLPNDKTHIEISLFLLKTSLFLQYLVSLWSIKRETDRSIFSRFRVYFGRTLFF